MNQDSNPPTTLPPERAPEKIQSEYEEIDLMDYVKVIHQRKGLIMAVFLLAVFGGILFTFLSPKVYKIDALLETGTLARQLLEEPGQLAEKIKGDIYGISVREKLTIPEAIYPPIKVENPKGTSLIKIEIRSSKINQAQAILKEINDLILKEHQEKLKTQKGLIEQNVKTLEDKIKIAENSIERTQNKIKPIDSDIIRIENKIGFAGEEKKNLEAKIEALEKILPYQQDPGTQFALFDTKEKLAGKKQEIENLYLSINSLKRSKEDLMVEINSLKTGIENLNKEINSLRASLNDIKPTRVIKEPTVIDGPIKPRPLLNMAMAAMLGVFAGVFLAFIKDWWEKNRDKLKT